MKRKTKQWFIAICIIIICTFLLMTYWSKPKINDAVSNAIVDALVTPDKEAEIQKDATKQAIDEAVNMAILGKPINKKEENIENSNTNNGESNSIISDAIKDTLNNVNDNTTSAENAVEVLEIIQCNILKIKHDGHTKLVRLIGVSPSGSKSGLESLLLSAKNLTIETDTKKGEGDYLLVYLWDGEPTSDGLNMINLQMVMSEYAKSTYDAGSRIIEQPNIKYFGHFISAGKH